MLCRIEVEPEAVNIEEAVTGAGAAQPPSDKKPEQEKEEKADSSHQANLEADPEACKVREWRYTLQNALLSAQGPPSDEDMPALDQLLLTVEQYEHPDFINFLMFSRIGKVMRHIAVLRPYDVPRDEEFEVRRRAQALVDKWYAMVAASKAANKPSKNSASVMTVASHTEEAMRSRL